MLHWNKHFDNYEIAYNTKKIIYSQTHAITIKCMEYSLNLHIDTGIICMVIFLQVWFGESEVSDQEA